MGRLTELKHTKFVAILYGKPKSGKTVLASQFPSPWFIDLDHGLGSVLAIRKELGLDFDFDVTEIDNESTEDPDFLKLCGKAFARQSAWMKLKKLVEVLCRKMPQDSTLVIDNLSRAGEFLIQHIKKTTGHNPMQIQDWGVFSEEMLFLFDLILGAKCNVIVVAHERTTKDELSGAIYRSLLVPGQSADRLPSVVDEFWYLIVDVKGTKDRRQHIRKLQTSIDRKTTAGSRSWMPDIENPTYDKLKSYLEKSLGRALPPATWTKGE